MHKKLIIMILLLTLAIPIYAQKELVTDNQKASSVLKTEANQKESLIQASNPANEKETKSFFDFLDKKAFASTIDKKEEKRILREKWKKLLGLDIFYPYFKAKEVEDWVKDKASVRFFKIKGRPKFDDNQVKYIFKVKF